MPQISDLLNYGVPVATSAAQGLLGRRAASSAQRALTQGGQQAIGTIQTGTDRAMDTLKGVFEGQKSTLNPFVTAGADALGKLQEGMAPGGGLTDPFQWMPPDLANDPIFKRRLAEGTKAIEAAGNAGGTRFSGGTMKELADYTVGEANDYLESDYRRNENTFRANQASKLGALQWLEGQGQSAANSEVAAGGTYGTNVASLESSSARSIADLQTEIANAEAGGDIAKANQLQGMLGNITSGIQQGRVLNKFLNGNHSAGAATQAPAGTPWQSLMPEALGENAGAGGPAISGLSLPLDESAAGVYTGLAGAGSAAGGIGASGAGLGSLAALQTAAPAYAGSLAALPAIPGGVAAAAPEVLPGVLAPSAAGTSGLGASLGAFFTNPITIGVGAAIAGAILWKKSQAHPTASNFVKEFQDPFGKHLGNIVDQFDRALASGQLDRATAEQLYQQTSDFINQFENDTQSFKAKGGKERTVAEQAKATMAKWAGPNWENVLGKMRQEIEGLV